MRRRKNIIRDNCIKRQQFGRYFKVSLLDMVDDSTSVEINWFFEMIFIFLEVNDDDQKVNRVANRY